MGFFEGFFNDTISYWSRTGTLDNYGKPSFNSPTTFLGRWEDKVELITDPQGREIRARARIWVPQAISIGDYLMLESFSSGDSDPLIIDGAYEIKDIREVRSIDGSETERIAFLA